MMTNKDFQKTNTRIGRIIKIRFKESGTAGITLC
jgi:hypothetical protein